ncbi:MAG: multicopper oxidase domain-containing protein, partial [Chlamydiia bacterium]|nr:multicopper oxidase domain-containing protein [Chlamydiia bacterium]
NFEVVQNGTFWMHSHFGLQEQKLMAAPLILLPAKKEPYRDVIALFESFTFQSIEEVWLGLRKEFMEMRQKKGGNWMPDLNPPQMNDETPDLNDVDFDAFLTNRKTLENPDIQSVQPGETLRLRLINGSVGTGFHIDLGKLEGKILAVDGNPIIPISLNKFPLATAQRADVLVTIPQEGGIFPIFAQGQGTQMRTGLILKTTDGETPTYPSTTLTVVEAITNQIEKDFHAKEPLKPHKIDRTLVAELNGNMKYYVWAINNHVWPNNTPLYVKEGERVELVFVNKTAMAHPMHLHGHVFQVVEIDGKKFSGAIRDTILVMPRQTVKVQFDANNPGIWAMHCHISYHLWAGMFTVIAYEGFKPLHFTKQQILRYAHTYGGY